MSTAIRFQVMAEARKAAYILTATINWSKGLAKSGHDSIVYIILENSELNT